VSPERSFDEYPEDAERAGDVIRLLRMPPSERPGLILAYFRGPDDAEHFTGMDSEETREAVARADAAIGEILAAIEELPDGDRVTLLVTTDHGMHPVSTIVNISRILRNHSIDARSVSTGTTAFLYLDDPAAVQRAYRALSRYEQFEVYRRESQPKSWHIGTGPRIGNLILSARPPYFIEDLEVWPAWARWLGRFGPEFVWAGFSLKATHGYPPESVDVDGILYASGRGIPRGRDLGRVRAIDLHPTVTRLLGLESGSPVDGEAIAAAAE
jgi:alkaline phosphatase D